MSSAPLRRTRSDLIATAVITLVCALVVAIAWFSAPIRSAELQSADTEHSPTALSTLPPELKEVFRVEMAPLAGVTAPITAQGLLISTDGSTIFAHDDAGSQRWSYRLGAPVCGLASAWDSVVAMFETSMGCSDIVAINAATGTYKATRSAIATDNPVTVKSNDRVGIVGPDRIDLWRSDLVRTVEYGEVEAPQESGFQPHPECRRTSALTRTETLALSEVCPDDESTTWIRFQDTTPEDSREPEMKGEASIDDPHAVLVAMGQTQAVVYVPGPPARLLTYSTSGELSGQEPVAEATTLIDAPTETDHTSAPIIGDLPHHITWFDGERLYLFTPSSMKVATILQDAIGTGVSLGDSFVYPTKDGLAVADADTAEVISELPLNREGYSGSVSLGVAGKVIVEKRGDELVALG